MAEARRLTGLFRRMRHLTDEDLLALIESATSDGHLDGCERCATRHAELLCVIADLDVVHVEADAAFDEERLLHQRTHIVRRLDKNNGPARVLPFPAAAEGSMRVLAAAGRRWVAAAAIAGVIVGIFSGRLLTHRTDRSSLEQMQAGYRTGIGRAAAGPGLVSADLRATRDEALLAEVESALSRPRVDELSAIDALTPAAR